MNLKYYFPVAALCLALASCNTGKQQTALTAGIDLANLDTTNLPGTSTAMPAVVGSRTIR